MRIGRFEAALLAGCVDGTGDTFRFAFLADGRVDRDAKQPRIKRRVTAERFDFSIRVEKSVLSDVGRFVPRPNDSQQRIEKPILMAQHERTKRFRLATDELFDQLLVGFAHNQIRIDDANRLFVLRMGIDP